MEVDRLHAFGHRQEVGSFNFEVLVLFVFSAKENLLLRKAKVFDVFEGLHTNSSVNRWLLLLILQPFEIEESIKIGLLLYELLELCLAKGTL